jgi:hypothetical protein
MFAAACSDAGPARYDAGGTGDGGSLVIDLGSDAATTTKPDASSDAGAADAADAAPIPDLTATCNPAKTWLNGVSVGVTTSSASLATINGSETSIAWLTEDDVVHYADRADTSSAFGADRTITSGVAPGERVALTSDGLTLYAIGADSRSLVAFVRGTTDDDFAAADSPLLDNLNAELAALESNATVSDLVVGTSSNVMLLRYVGGSSAGLRKAQRIMPTDAWPSTSPYAQQAELAVVNGKARRPTGLSLDGRALFFYDEVSGAQMVGFFAYDATTIAQFSSLGSKLDAQTNTDCTTLYFDDGSTIRSAAHN